MDDPRRIDWWLPAHEMWPELVSLMVSSLEPHLRVGAIETREADIELACESFARTRIPNEYLDEVIERVEKIGGKLPSRSTRVRNALISLAFDLRQQKEAARKAKAGATT